MYWGRSVQSDVEAMALIPLVHLLQKMKQNPMVFSYPACSSLVDLKPYMANNAHTPGGPAGWNFDALSQPSFPVQVQPTQAHSGVRARPGIDPALRDGASATARSRLDQRGGGPGLAAPTSREHSGTPARDTQRKASASSVIMELTLVKQRIDQLEEIDKERKATMERMKKKAMDDRAKLEGDILNLQDYVEDLEGKVKELRDLLENGEVSFQRGDNRDSEDEETPAMDPERARAYQTSLQLASEPSFKV